MKFFVIIILFFPLVTTVSSQNKTDVVVNKKAFNLVEEMDLYDQHLDTVYYMGTVHFKDGGIAKAFMNYNLLTNSILFLDENNRMLELTDLPQINNISYGTRNFIPVSEDRVAEVVGNFVDGSTLLLHRNTKIKNMEEYKAQQDRFSGHLGTKSVVADDMVALHIDNTTKLEVTMNSTYILKKDGEQFEIKNLRSLKKPFPDKYKALKKFADTIEFSNFTTQDYLVSYIRFCTE